MTEEVEINYEKANELTSQMIDLFMGHGVGDVLYALEKATSSVMLAHCVSLPAAKSTLKVLNDNIWDYIKYVDSQELASWNERSLN